MITFDDALRAGYLFLLMLIALRLDGVGWLSEWPWWRLALAPLLPPVAYMGAGAFHMCVKWFALTLRKLIWGR